MKTLSYILTVLTLCVTQLHGQTTFTFDTSTELTDNFDGDGNQVLIPTPGIGLGGSGALFQSANNDELWVLESTQGYSLTQGTYQFSTYFKLDNANSYQYITLGQSMVSPGAEATSNGNPLASMGGIICLNGSSLQFGAIETHPGVDLYYLTPNPVPVSVGNWYKFEVSISYITGDEFNIVATVLPSDSNGVVGAPLGTYDYAAVNSSNLDLPLHARYTRFMPFLGMSRSFLSNSNPGFRIVDDYRYSSPTPPLPLPSPQPVALNLNGPNDLTNNFNSDGSPTIVYSTTGGIGGSGAFTQTAGTPDEDTWTSKRSIQLSSDTLTLSAYFNLNDSCNDCQAGVGISITPETGANMPFNSSIPSIQLGIEGRGQLTLFTSDRGLTSFRTEPTNPTPLPANSWYFLKLDIVPVSPQETRYYAQLIDSDALGNLGNTRIAFVDTTTVADGDQNRIFPNLIDVYPLFFVANNNPSEDFGFRTVEGFSAGGPGTVVPVPTLSEWGLILLALTVLCIGGVYIRSRHSGRIHTMP